MAKKKKSDLKERLERYPQIKLTVVGRKTGQQISNPVWFRVRRRKALPASGARFRHSVVPQHARMGMARMGMARNRFSSPRASTRIDEFLRESDSVKSVIEKFREKYGAGDREEVLL